MSTTVNIERACKYSSIPPDFYIKKWVQTVKEHQEKEGEVCVYIVGEEESASLNYTWRNKEGSTNVLSFPAQTPENFPVLLLGDIAICAPVVEREATEQTKTLDAHWAHMVIHGTLHLLGYDHINDKDALEMETLEIHIMNKLGFPDPYKPAYDTVR